MCKTYVITGATSGIGQALLEKFEQNTIIFAGYRNPDCKANLEAISNNTNCPTIYPFYVDYAKPETIQSAIEYIKSKTNRVDRLINIAGCVVAGPMENIEISEVRRQFDVNVFGHLELAQGLINIMENGRIINISSMASFAVFPFVAPYCASKRCLDILFNSLLVENKKNIEVVSIKPGVIATPLWSKSIKENSKYFDKFQGYSDEMKYVIANAERNETRGLNVDEVVKVILKADRAENPKLSYTVGKDAVAASLVSKLPQRIINKIIKFGIKIKCLKHC